MFYGVLSSAEFFDPTASFVPRYEHRHTRFEGKNRWADGIGGDRPARSRQPARMHDVSRPVNQERESSNSVVCLRSTGKDANSANLYWLTASEIGSRAFIVTKMVLYGEGEFGLDTRHVRS